MKTAMIAAVVALVPTVSFAQGVSVSSGAFASSSGNSSAVSTSSAWAFSSSNGGTVVGGSASSTVGNGVTKTWKQPPTVGNGVSSFSYSNGSTGVQLGGVQVFSNPGVVMTPVPGLYR